MEGKKVYISAEQRVALISFVEDNAGLRAGKFTPTFTAKCAQNLWETITMNLNAMPGAKKDWKHWRKTWQDMKNKIKGKKAAIVAHARATGGGSPIQDSMNSEDDRVLQLIHPTAISGNPNIQESTIEFEYNLDSLEVEVDENIRPSTSQTPKTPGKMARRQKGRRSSESLFNDTLGATSKLAEQNEANIKLKKDYYSKKLEIMEADVVEKRRIADALENIASALLQK